MYRPMTLPLADAHNISIFPVKILNLSVELKASNRTLGKIKVGDFGSERTRKLVQAMKEADAVKEYAGKGPCEHKRNHVYGCYGGLQEAVRRSSLSSSQPLEAQCKETKDYEKSLQDLNSIEVPFPLSKYENVSKYSG